MSNLNLQDEFEKINKKYSNQSQFLEFTPSNLSLNLERYEYAPPSTEEIEKQAKQSLGDYYNMSNKAIENDYVSKEQSILTQENALQNNQSKAKESLTQATEQAKENASNNALKRGLARSTIVVTQMAAFDQAKLKEFAALDAEYTQKLSKLQSEKSLLEVQKQNALSSFDIAYAVKLSDKIAAINEEVNKKLDEVKKLNNQIEQQEASFAAAQEKENKRRELEVMEWNHKQLQNAGNYDLSKIERAKQEEKFEAALQYVNGMSKTDALKLIEQNQTLKNELGPLYIRLHAAITGRVG